MICNICGSSEFEDYNGRLNVICVKCHSFERHRLVKQALESIGMLNKDFNFESRVLHLAPEKMTYDYMMPIFGGGYYTADLIPEKYPYASCLRLRLPDDFYFFTDNYFDLILHNHVLEHIPGSYKSHLKEFVRILKYNCYMVFTLPGIRNDVDTIEDGESLESDELRHKIHGQIDHYKTFGKDFYDFLNTLEGSFNIFPISDADRLMINGGSDDVFMFKKTNN